MHSLYQFLKTTVIGGLVVLVPVALSGYIISALIAKVQSVLSPTAKVLHVESVLGTAVVEVAAVLLVVAACFLFGLLVRTATGQTIGSWLEERILHVLPGYQLMKKVSVQFAGGSDAAQWKPVLVSLGVSRHVGFLVEENSSDDVTVFVPFAPTVSIGAVHIVKSELVDKLDAPMGKVFDCITQLGTGSSQLISMAEREEK
jgi:uncharacterized membrane protein